MLICVKPYDGAIMAILKCCLNVFMMQIWNCLEVCYIAPTVFTSYFPHWSLCQWNSALLTVLVLSPTAIITSTNIHLFCDVFLMEHINWFCCCLPRYSIAIHFSRISGNAVLQLHTDVFTFLQYCCYVVVCRFVRSLMAFVCQEIKGLLTYFLTSHATSKIQAMHQSRKDRT